LPQVREKMTLSEKRRHFSKNFSLLVVWCHLNGYDVAIDTTRRTPEEQQRLIESGASQTMNSRHVDGLAGDLLLYDGQEYVTDPLAYAPLGEFWTSLDVGNVWGGDWESFPDFGHFEFSL
jgi:peptidoglycan LD-endopeptidase CwlK